MLLLPSQINYFPLIAQQIFFIRFRSQLFASYYNILLDSSCSTFYALIVTLNNVPQKRSFCVVINVVLNGYKL